MRPFERPSRDRARLLRPWIVCLLCLVFIDLALRVYVSTRFPSWSQRLPPERVQWDALAAEEALSRLAGYPGRKILFLGDSVMVGEDLPFPETVPGQLETKLRAQFTDESFTVSDLAMAASRLGDTYAMLVKASATHPDIVVVEINYQMFSRAQADEQPFRYPYLRTAVDRTSTYQQMAARLKLPQSDSRGDALIHFTQEIWALYRYRELVDGLIFQGTPVDRLHGARPSPIAATREPQPGQARQLLPWHLRHVDVQQTVGAAYDNDPLDSFPNPALFFARELVRFLNAHEIRALVFLTPLNHVMLRQYIDTAAFDVNVRRIDALFSGQGFIYRNYQDLLSGDLFTDDDHLTSAGSARLAEVLFRDVEEYFESVLGKEEHSP